MAVKDSNKVDVKLLVRTIEPAYLEAEYDFLEGQMGAAQEWLSDSLKKIEDIKYLRNFKVDDNFRQDEVLSLEEICKEKRLVIYGLQSPEQLVRFNACILNGNSVAIAEYGLKTNQNLSRVYESEIANAYSMDFGKESRKLIEESILSSSSIDDKKTMIAARVDPDIFAAFKLLSILTGHNMDYLIHKGVALLLKDANIPLPGSLEQKIADPTPKRRGPAPGTGGRPRKSPLFGG